MSGLPAYRTTGLPADRAADLGPENWGVGSGALSRASDRQGSGLTSQVASAPLCFHCHEPLGGSTLVARINNEARPVCCAGCLAVAELIAGAGLDDYYRYRDTPSQKVDDDALSEDAWAAYARPEVEAQFTTEADGRRSTILIIEGLRCTACSWLIDNVLKRLHGVTAVSVNAAVGRAHVEWQPDLTNFAEVLRAIARLGYRPHPVTDARVAQSQQDERRSALKRLLVAGFGMMQVMMFAVSTYSAELAAEIMDAGIWSYFRIISLLVTTPVLLYAGAPILASAWRSVSERTIGMDVPVSIALVLAYFASVWNTWRGSGEVYFDSVTMFVFFLTLGRFVEMIVRHRTASVSDALARHLPATAHRVEDGEVTDVASTQLAAGDVVLVRPGEVIPADGVIIEGATSVDEAMLTGESTAVRREVGGAVNAGTINVSAPFNMQVSAVGRSTVLSGIVNLLQRAQTQKPTLAKAADQAAARFLQGVLVASGVVLAGWLAMDPSRAFEATLAVLVVACPCAFAIAMPAALASAAGALARRGVLVTRPDAIEKLARLDTIIFDKTGTLTRGELKLERVTPLGSLGSDECLSIAAALERFSEHPLARVFSEVSSTHVATEVIVAKGCGLQGTVDGQTWRIGHRAYVSELSGTTMQRDFDSAAATIVTLGNTQGPLAFFDIHDELRTQAAQAVSELANLGMRAEIASGDGASVVSAVAQRSRIPTFRARCTPEAKLARVKDLQSHGHHVAMIGDGINDAPVLAAADVSIAMGRGAALAQASADIVLVNEDLSALPVAVALACRTMRVAKQNLYWAAAYNFLSLPLAALGFIPPWLAALGMSLSSIAVIGNGARLLKSGRPDDRPTGIPAYRNAGRNGEALHQ